MKFDELILTFFIVIQIQLGHGQITNQPRCTRAGIFITHPQSCQWYIECTGVGLGRRGECPPGLLFSPLGFCDHANKVDCSAGLNWNGVCQAEHIGFFFPHPSSCKLWIRCDAVGIHTEGWCEIGQYYNPMTRFCDDAANVDCKIEKPTHGPTKPTLPPSGTTRPAINPPSRPPSGTTTTRPNGAPTRPGINPPTRAPSGTTTTRPNGAPTRPGIHPPTRPSLGTTKPNRPSRPTARPSTKPTSGPTIEPPTHRPAWNWVCEPQHVGEQLWPHPNSCEMYIICSGPGQFIEDSCPEGFRLNPIDGFCDPEDMIDCVTRAPEVTTHFIQHVA